jgi:hypothetical protein
MSYPVGLVYDTVVKPVAPGSSCPRFERLNCIRVAGQKYERVPASSSIANPDGPVVLVYSCNRCIDIKLCSCTDFAVTKVKNFIAWK